MIGGADLSDYPASDGLVDARRERGEARVAPGLGPGAASSLAVSVHGPLGVLDLVVPAGAATSDVASEYARQSGLASIPLLYTRIGEPLSPDTTLADAGVDSGDLLVATTTIHRPAASARHHAREASAAVPGPLSMLWFTVASALAVLAGWYAARTDPSAERTVTIALLMATALLGVLPFGRFAAHRAYAAPAFATAAAFVIVWDPAPARLPMVVGIAALTGAVTAAVARALDDEVDEGLRVWMVAGGGLFLIAGASALFGASPVVVWSMLVVLAVLAARFVPGLAVDVPDQLLIDLERLAVTAWSARERPRGRRGRAVASPAAVERVAAHGARLVTAAGVAIAVVAVLSAVMLLSADTVRLDGIGAKCQVFFAGGALLLAGRSYRHTGARVSLRAAGLGCWVVLAWQLLSTWPAERSALAGGAAIGLAVLMVVVAVAAGRGWRSAWWARRAEVAEGLCGAFAIASLFVATGLCRAVWEATSNVSV